MPPGSTVNACFKNSTQPLALPLLPLRNVAHNSRTVVSIHWRGLAISWASASLSQHSALPRGHRFAADRYQSHVGGVGTIADISQAVKLADDSGSTSIVGATVAITLGG